MMNYKKFINFFLASMIAAGLALLFGKSDWFPSFYMPKFMGIASFASALLIILPKIIFRPADEKKKEALIKLQFYTAVALVLNGLGGLGFFQFYRYGLPYDKIVHFIVSLMATIGLTQFICAWWNWEFKKAITAVIILIMAGGVGWEGFEFLTDFVFKTKTFGIYGEYVNKDTIMDIILNVLGIIAGFIILLKRKKLASPYKTGRHGFEP
ncbi:MAG: hypothetical protein HY773_00165 [Candidatus Terrybacteria bacterium]|nr:hypothetical protein [Candidatus Terrybacteria bacterium]